MRFLNSGSSGTRCFIAFPISEEAKNEIVKIQTEVSRLNPKMPIKFSEKHNLHVTVEFLGELTEEQIGATEEILSDISTRHHPFKYWLQAVDGFPNLNSPHVLVVKTREEGRAGDVLHDELFKRLMEKGIATDAHPWRPHITLGRIKRIWSGPIGLVSMKVTPIVFTVNEMILYKSELSARGPNYEVINTFKLK